jgi:hypothetical protein
MQGISEVEYLRHICALTVIIGFFGTLFLFLDWISGTAREHGSGFGFTLGWNGIEVWTGIWNYLGFSISMGFTIPEVGIVILGVTLTIAVGLIVLMLKSTKSTARFTALVQITAGVLVIAGTVAAIARLSPQTGSFTETVGSSTYAIDIAIGAFAYAELLIGMIVVILGLYMMKLSLEK